MDFKPIICDGLSQSAKNRFKNFINLSDRIGEINPLLRYNSEYRQLKSKINLSEEKIINTYSYLHHIVSVCINYKKVNYIFTINKNEGVKFVSAN